MEPLKKFSPAFYGIIILLFFLPFVNLSCSGQTIMSLSGFQLITGSEYKANSMFGETTEGEVKENKISTISLVCTINCRYCIGH